MDKIKRIVLVNIPTGKCNFKCPYCYISQVDAWAANEEQNFPSNQIISKAFSQERLGGICYVNLCSRGETLIYPQVIACLKSILAQGHYVEVVTNGTITQRFKEISTFSSELLSRLSFKFSFHYTELKRLNMMDIFFNNVNMMKESGASFAVELTPVDEEEKYIDDIKNICMENLGAWCHVTMARDDRKKEIPVLSTHSKEEYVKIWSQFDSGMIEFKSKVFQQKRKEFCYAGDWSIYVNLFTGDIQKCYSSPIYGNLYDFSKKIPFRAIGVCPISHCYNSHMLMTWGLIPSIETPTYSFIRNRKCIDGSEWLQPSVKSFYKSKLIESNKEYSEETKRKIVKDAHALYKRLRFYKRISKPFNKVISKMTPEQREKVRGILRAK